MKFKKPGNPIKKTKIWNKSPRLHAIDKLELICTHCGKEDPTCCFHHVEDYNIKFKLGGGGITGGKVPDYLVALLCKNCGDKLDTKPDKNSSELEKLNHSMKWSLCIIRTLNRRLNEN